MIDVPADRKALIEVIENAASPSFGFWGCGEDDNVDGGDILTAIEAVGCVVVPVKPTGEELAELDNSSKDYWRATWAAMVEASPYRPEPEK